MDRLFKHQVFLEAVDQSGGEDPWSIWFLVTDKGPTGIASGKCHSVPRDQKSTTESEDQVSVDLPLIDHVKFPTDLASVLKSTRGIEGEAHGIPMLGSVADVEPLECYLEFRGGLVGAIEFSKPEPAVRASGHLVVQLGVTPAVE